MKARREPGAEGTESSEVRISAVGPGCRGSKHKRERSQPPGDLVEASALKIRVARIISSNGAGRVIGTLTRNRLRHQGLRFDVRSEDFSPSVRAQMFWGSYEGAEIRMIRGFLRDSTAVVELGSSLGVTTAHIAAIMDPRGHLVCVEANPRLVPGLRERTLQRAATRRVDIVHAAVTHYCGTTVLTVADKNTGSRLGSPRPHEETAQVPALTLREILSRTGIAEFDLVSDIEGAESSFLLSDPGALHRCRRAVLELHDTTTDGQKVSVHDLMDAAVTAGFQIVSRYGPVVALAR